MKKTRVLPTDESSSARSLALKHDNVSARSRSSALMLCEGRAPPLVPQVRIKLKLHQKEAELHLLHSLKLGALQRELEERELEAELKEQRQNHIAMHETEQRSKLTLEQERDQKCELIEAESKRVQAQRDLRAADAVE